MNKEKMPVIRILLIDDQPSNLNSKGIPEVKNDDLKNDQFNGIEKYFEVMWLQDINDIKEYRNLCRQAEDNFGSEYLGENGWVPEIVCFDYALKPGKNMYTGFPENIKKSNPNIVLNKILGNKKRLVRDYTDSEKITIKTAKIQETISNLSSEKKTLFENLSQDNKQIWIENYLIENDKLPFYEPEITVGPHLRDNMGLYGGALIVSQFRKHPCVGIPTTSKNEKELRGTEAEFFEWLLEEELNYTFFHGVLNQKWTTLLPKAVGNLRVKIQKLLSGGKIYVPIGTIADLLEGDYKANKKSQIFTYVSEYGLKNLPLDGLFIDFPVDERNEEIKKFASSLLLINATLTHIEINEFIHAKNISKRFISVYRSDSVNKRIDLSLLILKKVTKTIDNIESKRFINLLEFFGIGNQEIEAFEKGDTSNAVVRHKVSDFRNQKVKDNDVVNRLIVLFTVLRLHALHQSFIVNNSDSAIDNELSQILEEPPTFDDLLFALYPVAYNPLVLPMHQVYLPENLRCSKEIWTKPLGRGSVYPQLIQQGQEFPANLSAGEKIICKNFAIEIKLNQKFYPNWLKNI